MIFPTRIGTDLEGYILNKISVDKIPEQYAEPLDFIVKDLKGVFDTKIHSVYIYGSVGRGNAIVGKSDIDLSIIISDQILNEERKLLELGKMELFKKYDYIPKVDYDIGTLEEVLSPDSLYDWGFWFKHCCACLYGEDLGKRFPKMKPRKEITLSMNKKIENQLQNYIKQIGTETDSKKLNLLIKSALKRIIRGCYTLTLERDMSWSDNISENVEIFINYYPKETKIMKVKELLEETKVSKEEVIELLEYFRCWIVQELNKIRRLPSIAISE